MEQQNYVVYKCSHCGNISLPDDNHICRYCNNVMTETISDKSYFDIISNPIQISENISYFYPNFYERKSNVYTYLLILRDKSKDLVNIMISTHSTGFDNPNDTFYSIYKKDDSFILLKSKLNNILEDLEYTLVAVPTHLCATITNEQLTKLLDDCYEERYKNGISLEYTSNILKNLGFTNYFKIKEYLFIAMVHDIYQSLNTVLWDSPNYLVDVDTFLSNPYITIQDVGELSKFKPYIRCKNPNDFINNNIYDKYIYFYNIQNEMDIIELFSENYVLNSNEENLFLPLENTIETTRLNSLSKTIHGYFLLKRLGKDVKIKLLLEVTKDNSDFKHYSFFLVLDNCIINFNSKLGNDSILEFDDNSSLKEFIMKLYEEEKLFKKTFDCDAFIYEFNNWDDGRVLPLTYLVDTDFIIEIIKYERETQSVNEDVNVLNEANSISNDLRKKIENKIYSVFNILDKTGSNTKKYRELFSGMSNEQFTSYMKGFLKDDKENFYLEVLPNKNEPSLKDIKKCLEFLKVPMDEYVYFRHDGHKEDPIRTRYKVPTGYILLRRLQQILSKKNSYSLSISQRSLKTNQVTSDSKVARISDAENYSLSAIGADYALKEFLGPRADAQDSKTELYKQISNFGYAYQKDLPNDLSKKQTLNTIDVFFIGAGIETDLLEDNVNDKGEEDLKNLQKLL